MLWFTIPHFSGGAPQVEGSVPEEEEEEEEETTTTTSGGGGGGGGGLLPPPLTAPSEIAESIVKFLKANEVKIITVPSIIMEEIGLTEIEAILDRSLTISATISKVASLPSSIPSPEGEAYTFFEIVFTQYGTQSEVEPSGHIKHRISKEWLNSINADSSDVKFLKYKDGKWVELSSEIIDEDSEFIYYKVNLDSFSLFAVVVEKVTKPTVPYIPPQKTPEPPGALGTPEPPTPTPATIAEAEEGFPLHYAAGGLLIAIAAIAVAVILKRRK
jgi:PGF-pre-PGF domain-containing protein